MHPSLRTALTALLVCAGYYVGGIVSLMARFESSGISIIWLPNALLLATLLLTPARTWWVYLLAAFPIHLHLVTHFQGGVPALIMLWQFGGNGVQTVVAALAVRRVIGTPPRLDTLRSMAAFALLAAIAAPAVASALAVSLFVLSGWVTEYWLTWWRRFCTNVVPTLTLTPLILLTVTDGIATMRHTPVRRVCSRVRTSRCSRSTR
jgi:integral membrane sensor domain MASE1